MFFKRIIYILLILLVAALGFQLARTYIFTRFIGNTNKAEVLQDPVSASVPGDISFDKYLVIYDGYEANSSSTLSQIEKVLEYMKIDYSSIDVSQAGSIETDSYECIIFAFERLDNLGDSLSRYMKFVENGGSLIFALRPVIDDGFRSIAGLLAIDSYEGIADNAKGIRTDNPLAIGMEGFESELGFIQNSSIDAVLDLEKDAILYLSTYNRIPLLWKKDHGSGRFIFFNGTMLNDKNNRGILTNIITLSRDVFIYPVANIKMVHIDDFPAPIPQGTDDAIMEEFSRTIPGFYREIWWSDMIRLSKKYDIAYTGFVIEDYGNDTRPPFESAGRMDEENLLVYGKELLNLGGEIGIHGYNHQSLAPEGYIKQDLGYNPWTGQEDMEASLYKLLGFINSVFKNYRISAYVPPSNILSPMGRAAVVSAAEDLEVIASVYLPNIEGDVYTQEFEEAIDGIMEFPRISYGYNYTPEIMWSAFNALNTHGIFSHFIHPDDILDPERNMGKSWSGLVKDYEKILAAVHQDFYWLESYTISEGSRQLKKYLDIKPYIEYAGNTVNIYCEDFRPDACFIMRTEKSVSNAENIRHIKLGDDSYMLILEKASGSIVLEDN